MATQQISGLISGLDTASIIESLMSIESQKVDNLEEKKAEKQIYAACYQSINTLLLEYCNSVSDISDSSLWDSYSVSSSDESSLTASVSEYASAGTYVFRAVQLAQATQYMSAGFADRDSTAVSPTSSSEIRIDSAKSSLNRSTELSLLNGGSGVDQGSIRITDKSGNTAVIDLSGAEDIDEVLEKINSAGVSVTASIAENADGTSQGRSLVLTDSSGGSGTLKVENVGSTTIATDLGIEGNDSSSSGYIRGDNIYGLTKSTSLSMLHDGLGVNDGVAGEILIRDENSGDEWTVDLSSAKNINSVIAQIESHTDGKVSVSISADGMGLSIQGEPGADLTISSVGDNNTTAEDLGIAGSNMGASVEGLTLIADMNSVQLASLSGVNGTGINGARGDCSVGMGVFEATVDGTTVTFDLSSLDGGDSLDDALSLLNSQAASQLGEGVLTFSINSAGNGILVENNSGGSAEFADITGTTAADLGLTGGTISAGEECNCGDLDLNYISRATSLDNLNGGSGVSSGSFLLSDASGFSAEIDISDAETIGEVIDLINESGLDVIASVNATGDGILITESPDSGGTGNIKVEEVSGGSVAEELGIIGSGSGGDSGVSVLDGSFETVITIDENDTLTDLMNKISEQSSLEASIINDGSEYAPYRLVISGSSTGKASDFIIDSDMDILNFSKTSTAQDSVLLYGGDEDGAGAVALKSSTNTNNSALLGVTLNLNSISDSQVSITVSQDTDSITTEISEMVDAYNGLFDLVSELDQYISDEDREDLDDDSVVGLLYADSATRNLMNSLTESLFMTRDGCGDITSIFNLGITFDDEGHLELDTSELESLLSSNFEDVKKFLCNSEDVATVSSGASATASSPGANGTSVSNLINGDSNSSNFGEENGYEASDTIGNGANTVTITFNQPQVLDYLVINHVNSDDYPASEYALSDFTVEYLDSSTGKWETLRTVTGNQASYTAVGFADPTSVSAIRIVASDTNAEDDVMRLTEIECISNNGVANKWQEQLDQFTDSETGYYAVLNDSIETQIDELEDSIESVNELLEMKEEALWAKFTAMELTLSTLQSQSDYFDTQMSAWTSSD